MGTKYLFKPMKIIDEEYLIWIASHACIFGINCQGDVVAHHVQRRGIGGGKRNDYRTLPACVFHNGETENIPDSEMEEKYSVNLGWEIAMFASAWLAIQKVKETFPERIDVEMSRYDI